MARKPSQVIEQRNSQTSLEEARSEVFQRRCALTRANDELRKAEVAFKKESDKVRGKPVEDYPQSYFDAEARRDTAFSKMTDADGDYWTAREELSALRTQAAQAAAALAERQMNSAEAAFATS